MLRAGFKSLFRIYSICEKEKNEKEEGLSGRNAATGQFQIRAVLLKRQV
jgi:hypothetical protein